MDLLSPVTHLLYLHGFRSSPQSTKARIVEAWVQRHRPALDWWCPQLPPSPRDAMAQIEHGLRDWPVDRLAVIGSSLGGYYAHAVACRTGCRAVLLNPAVDPARDLAAHIGATTSWHSDEPFYFRPEFIQELRALEAGEPEAPERVLAIIAKGDEVLDWREMHARHRHGRVVLLDGSDHALSGFETQLLPTVIEFLGLAPPPTT